MRRAGIAVLVLVGASTLAACGGGGSTSSGTNASGPPAALLHPGQLNATAPQVFDVRFATTKGDFTVRVHRAWAPHGADRFYDLVRSGFYDEQKFFRVVPKFVIQFGISPYPSVSKAWADATIPDDPVAHHNIAGTVDFASAGPGTRTTQIFVNLADNASLDGQGFAPFGAVTSGMQVLGKLYSGYGDAPTPHQGEMQAQGNAYLEDAYPKLDAIETATIVAK